MKNIGRHIKEEYNRFCFQIDACFTPFKISEQFVFMSSCTSWTMFRNRCKTLQCPGEIWRQHANQKGPWWWASGQSACLRFRRIEFKSFWIQRFFCKISIWKERKEAGVGPFLKYVNQETNRWHNSYKISSSMSKQSLLPNYEGNNFPVANAPKSKAIDRSHSKATQIVSFSIIPEVIGHWHTFPYLMWTYPNA